MSLQEIRIHNLRLFQNQTFQFAPHSNFIIAPNGHGKTSVLEAIYLLSCGHSFRNREISPLISHGQSSLTLFSMLHSGDTLSIQKASNEPTRIKINRHVCHATSALARYLPCQIYYQDIFSLMDGSPSLRRTMLDWGVFHVEQAYHILLKDYRKLLKHRNILLRQKQKRQSFEPWDRQMSTMAEEIHKLRSEYMFRLEKALKKLLSALSSVSCEMVYEKGWDKKGKGESLYTQLDKNFEKDCIRGYTSVGVHQADIHFTCEGIPAKKLLSRGQQKIVLIAVKLAQTRLLDKDCIHLLDDVFAELDSTHIEALLKLIGTMNGQFITSLLPAGEVHLPEVDGQKIIRL